jgi:hypothetical protein
VLMTPIAQGKKEPGEKLAGFGVFATAWLA